MFKFKDGKLVIQHDKGEQVIAASPKEAHDVIERLADFVWSGHSSNITADLLWTLTNNKNSISLSWRGIGDIGGFVYEAASNEELVEYLTSAFYDMLPDNPVKYWRPSHSFFAGCRKMPVEYDNVIYMSKYRATA